MQIDGSVVLVTGANRGIGRELVAALLERGASRVYAGSRSGATMAEFAALDRDRVVAQRLDVTDRRQVAEAAAAAPDVTLLINNAATAAFGSVVEAPEELIVRDLDTNYYGALRMVREFAPVIRRNGGGAIVNMLTIVALASFPGLGGYNASKAAAWSMTQSARADLAGHGIEVVGVYPGPVDTDMIREVQMPKATPRDVAAAILDGLEAGDEDIFPDPMSSGFYARWREDHKEAEREMAGL